VAKSGSYAFPAFAVFGQRRRAARPSPLHAQNHDDEQIVSQRRMPRELVSRPGERGSISCVVTEQDQNGRRRNQWSTIAGQPQPYDVLRSKTLSG
jgi:hypothetical protein